MNELKNIKHFQEFKDSVNEELLWDAVKSLLSSLFSKMDKKFSDSINNFTKKIDGTKTWEEAVKFMEQADGDVKNKMTEGLKTVTGPLGLRKLLVDTTNTIFTELMVLFNRYGQKDATPRKIFEGTPNEKMFAFDKAKDFETGLFNFLNTKIIELNKGQNGQFAYDEKALQTYLTNQKDINAVDPQQPVPAGKTEQAKTNTEIAGGEAEGATGEKINYRLTDKLNEDETPQPVDPNAPPKGTIANLTTPATAWVNEELLGVSLKKLQSMKPPSKIGQEDAFTAVAKNTKVSANKESVAKLLRGIVNLPEDKKGDLIKMRDILATATGKSPDDLKNEIPL